ncbi:TetR family transcriptional regulator [Actinoplanes sp. NPDC026619]|uniref:TetR/AcrR family transcriptional regulator n=1 Tax=Actinoplanes sp. NPDC026619 TaxID=3155798 RepID=UPI0033DB796B
MPAKPPPTDPLLPPKERDAARTRRQVLGAAARTVAAHGAGVSLDVIAREAGVSKSGLLHHFRSRDQLLLALTDDLVEQFRADVEAAADPRDHAAGRLVRAYVTATLGGVTDAPGVSAHVKLVAALSAVPGVDELLRRDTRRWQEAFAADGLHPDRALLITRAADGASLAALYEGGVDHDQLRHTRDLLLALSRGAGPL